MIVHVKYCLKHTVHMMAFKVSLAS